MSVRTVKVNNISLSASVRDIQEFFCFSGDIECVEMHKDELSQIAYITFKDTQGAEMALLLTGATIIDMAVIITPAMDYQLPASVLSVSSGESKMVGGIESALQKAEDVVNTTIAKGYILGKDAIDKAKSFDEKHQLTSSAAAQLTSFDKKIGLSEKVTMGAAAVNEKMREMDEKYHVSEKTVMALMAAEQKVTNAGSAIMKNRYILTGTGWVTNAYNRVTSATSEANMKTSEKIASAEAESYNERDFAQVQVTETSDSSRPVSRIAIEDNQSVDEKITIHPDLKQVEEGAFENQTDNVVSLVASENNSDDVVSLVASENNSEKSRAVNTGKANNDIADRTKAPPEPSNQPEPAQG